MYQIEENTYSKIVNSKTYKKNGHNIYSKINKEAKYIANNYGVSGRVHCLSKSNTFITLKDHKSNFSSNPKCHKYFLQQLNSKVRDLSSVRQLQETSTMID